VCLCGGRRRRGGEKTYICAEYPLALAALCSAGVNCLKLFLVHAGAPPAERYAVREADRRIVPRLIVVDEARHAGARGGIMHWRSVILPWRSGSSQLPCVNPRVIQLRLY